MRLSHRMPFGPELSGDAARFRLWAPAADAIELEHRKPDGKWLGVPMTPGNGGWFDCVVEDCPPGTLYRFHLQNDLRVPDPASRFQPEGVHGPSELIAPEAFEWQDGDWHGRAWEETVLYELHCGCFSPEGSYDGLRRRLDHLVSLGVTALELMPLSQAPGKRNWGYDGVQPFAPSHNYGRPEDLKKLVQEAHRRGLMVFLDVVYNHFGPDGNYLHAYAPDFFTERHETPWGQAINFDGARSETVRRFFIDNALYWLNEYHMDGLRLDAVHAICDDSRPDILEELADTVRARMAPNRHVHLVLENDHNAAHYLRPRGRYDAQWNDDIHHAMHVLLTGERSGYYADYSDRPLHHLGRCLTEGFAYQGEHSRYRDEPRGERSAGMPPSRFVAFLQNHDQTGNRAFGERLSVLSGDAERRAMIAMLLLAPSPPLLFMGDEWGTRRPFLYFCDFDGELADAVRRGRRQEFERFPEFSDRAVSARIPDPNAPATFAASCLDWNETAIPEHREWLAYHRHLLTLRRNEITPLLPGLADGVAECPESGDHLRVRWHGRDGGSLTLLANLCGRSTETALAAPPPQRLLFSTHRLDRRDREHVTLPAWHVSWFAHQPGATHAQQGRR